MPSSSAKQKDATGSVRSRLSALIGSRTEPASTTVRSDNSITTKFVNYSLPEKHDFKSAQTSKLAVVAPHIRVAIGTKRGTIAVKPDDTLAVRISDLTSSDTDTDWIELSIELRDSAWLSCSQIHLRYSASAKAPTHIRPAMRILYSSGFHDHFVGEGDVIDAPLQSHGATFDLPPNLMSKAVRLDLHLFFGLIETTIHLHDLALTGVQ